MKKDIVYIEKNEPVTTTKIIAKCLGREHRKIIDLIEKNYSDSPLHLNDWSKSVRNVAPTADTPQS